MIIAKAVHDATGRETLILGLTMENIKRMLNGQPVLVSERTNAPKGSMPGGTDIVIAYGSNPQDLFEQFKAAGMITAETKVHVDPRLGDANAPQN